MITLALDTSGPWCSVAIVSQARILSHPAEKIGRGHAERLAPMVGIAIEQADITPVDINRIAVCTGPGSFTGLRVALAFGRSFALPRKLPVIGISALQAMAAAADPQNNRSIISAINAKRGDICWAYFKNGQQVFAPKTMPIEQVNKVIQKLSFDQIIGDANELLGVELNGIDHVSAPILGWMAVHLKPQDYPPDPFYARGPDAKLPRGKKL